jgi:hypothetical protein
LLQRSRKSLACVHRLHRNESLPTSQTLVEESGGLSAVIGSVISPRMSGATASAFFRMNGTVAYNAHRSMSRFRTVTLICFALIAAILCAQTAVLTSGHNHHSSDQCCLTCKVGAAPSITANAPVAYVTLMPAACLEQDVTVEAPQDPHFAITCSRAPPA